MQLGINRMSNYMHYNTGYVITMIIIQLEVKLAGM